jgi:uncharacterized protein YpmB
MTIRTTLVVAATIAAASLNVTAANAQYQSSRDTAQHQVRTENRGMRSDHMDVHRGRSSHRHCTTRWNHHRRVRVCR